MGRLTVMSDYFVDLANALTSKCTEYTSVFDLEAATRRSSESLKFAPTLDMNDEVHIADIVSTNAGFFFPWAVLIALLLASIFIFNKKLYNMTFGKFGWSVKKGLFIILASTISLVVCGILAMIYGGTSSLNSRQCQLGELFQSMEVGHPERFWERSSTKWIGMGAVRSSLTETADEIEKLSAVDMRALALSDHSNFLTSYSAASALWTAIINDAHTRDIADQLASPTFSTSIGSMHAALSPNFNATYTVLFGSVLSDPTSTVNQVTRSSLRNSVQSLETSAEMLAKVGETLLVGTMDNMENSRVVIIMTLSCIAAVFAVVTAVFYGIKVFETPEKTSNSVVQTIRASKFVWYGISILFLLSAAVFMIFSNAVGSVCNSLLVAEYPFDQFSNIFTDLKEPIVFDCFNWERKADFYRAETTNLISVTQPLVALAMGAANISPLATAVSSGTYPTGATVTTFANNVVGLVESLNAALCPADASMALTATKLVSCPEWVATVKAYKNAAFSKSGSSSTSISSTDVSFGGAAELASSATVNGMTLPRISHMGLMAQSVSTLVNANLVAFKGRQCQASGKLIKNLLAHVCVNEVSDMIISSNLYVGIAFLVSLSFFLFAQAQKKLENVTAQENQNPSAQYAAEVDAISIQK
eukprot:GDKJ01007767.1.p1 GENE.GDKJ01007767.1~~GDKJ01007767.1.p1  ORF type:complete len:646 (+),score=148.55 GDKJ01007767.1:1-1938(+)